MTQFLVSVPVPEISAPPSDDILEFRAKMREIEMRGNIIHQLVAD